MWNILTSTLALDNEYKVIFGYMDYLGYILGSQGAYAMSNGWFSKSKNCWLQLLPRF